MWLTIRFTPVQQDHTLSSHSNLLEERLNLVASASERWKFGRLRPMVLHIHCRNSSPLNQMMLSEEFKRTKLSIKEKIFQNLVCQSPLMYLLKNYKVSEWSLKCKQVKNIKSTCVF